MIYRSTVVSTLFLFVFLSFTAFGATPKGVVKKSLPKKSKENVSNVSGDSSATEISDYLAGLKQKVVNNDEEEPIDRPLESALSTDEENIPLNLSNESKQKSLTMTSLQKMLAAVGTIILFSLVAFYYIHRSGKKGALLSGSRNIQILSTKPLGPKKDLMVIKIAGESLLIGVTDNNINLIKNLAILDDEMPALNPNNFATELNQNLRDEKPSAEQVDGYQVSKLEDVKNAVMRRFTV